MRIEGYDVDDRIVGEVMKMVRKQQGNFEASHVVACCREAGMPEGARYRGADRILQKMRKKGEIEFCRGGYWRVLQPASA